MSSICRSVPRVPVPGHGMAVGAAGRVASGVERDAQGWALAVGWTAAQSRAMVAARRETLGHGQRVSYARDANLHV